MASSRFYVKSPQFTRYTRGMKGFRNAWRGEARKIASWTAQRTIELAKEEKPDLAGRSGNLNRSWFFDKPRYKADTLKTTVFNLAPYALTVEEGITSPKPVWVRGSFNPAFRTGHGLPMFFPSSDGRYFFMPRRPWKGFFMLEYAIKNVEDLIQPEFSSAVYRLAKLKGIN